MVLVGREGLEQSEGESVSLHRKELHRCKGCGEIKLFPADAVFCSWDCRYQKPSTGTPVVQADLSELEVSVLAFLGRGVSELAHLCNSLDKGPKTIEKVLEALREKGYNLRITGTKIELSSEFTPTREITQILHPVSTFGNQIRKIGALGDNHLGSNHERLDVLNALYDIYQEEEVTDVYNTGNWIEGISRLNNHDRFIHGWGDQVDYFVQNYPHRPGITTHFIAGDDHEGWIQRDTRIEIGRYAEWAAIDGGRTDLHYLGYVEADVLLKAPGGSQIMKVMHPGGGSAYATSYAAQKLVESFQGGEKPGILLIGHYHKFEYLYVRGVHVVQTACTVDQSIFMRKQKIAAHVGGTLLTFNQAEDGSINRFGVQFFPFFDRGYYLKRREFGLNRDS